MTTVTVELSSIDGTEAALGRAGGHTVVVDRPDGRAGGLGLGFNGAQLLGLAAGGCFCNDLRYAAHELGIRLTSLSVTVAVELGGEPLVATAITVDARIETAGGADPAPVLARARAICTVANSLIRGVPVDFAR
jgi:organic hydroperoxide reductase OsmC/OhrA